MSNVIATYVGPIGYALDNGTQLIPGETEVELPSFQAQDDEAWQADNGNPPAPPALQSGIFTSNTGDDD